MVTSGENQLFSKIVALEWQTLSHPHQLLHPQDHRHHSHQSWSKVYPGTHISRRDERIIFFGTFERFYIVLRRRRGKLLIALSVFCHIRWYFIWRKVVSVTQAFRDTTTTTTWYAHISPVMNASSSSELANDSTSSSDGVEENS